MGEAKLDADVREGVSNGGFNRFRRIGSAEIVSACSRLWRPRPGAILVEKMESSNGVSSSVADLTVSKFCACGPVPP